MRVLLDEGDVVRAERFLQSILEAPRCSVERVVADELADADGIDLFLAAGGKREQHGEGRHRDEKKREDFFRSGFHNRCSFLF